jgi:hypothetical protein
MNDLDFVTLVAPLRAVLYDKAGVQFPSGPRRREAAAGHSLYESNSAKALAQPNEGWEARAGSWGREKSTPF